MSLEIAQLTARNQSLEHQNRRLRQGKPTLTKRERQVYLLIAAGIGVTEIGRRIFLSPKTISSYRDRLLVKLNLSNNAEITMHAIRNRLLVIELLPPEECIDV